MPARLLARRFCDILSCGALTLHQLQSLSPQKYICVIFILPAAAIQSRRDQLSTYQQEKKRAKKGEENELQILWRDKPFGNRIDFFSFC